MKPALSAFQHIWFIYHIEHKCPDFCVDEIEEIFFFFLAKHTIGSHHFPQTAVWVYEPQMFIYNYSSIH